MSKDYTGLGRKGAIDSLLFGRENDIIPAKGATPPLVPRKT